MAQPFPGSPPVAAGHVPAGHDSGERSAGCPPSSELPHQQQALPNHYIGPHQPLKFQQDMGRGKPENPSIPLKQNPSYEQVVGGSAAAPPPLPPKPAPKSQPRPPAGAQFLREKPPNHLPGGGPPGALPRPHFDPTAPPTAAQAMGSSDRDNYSYVLDPKQQEINHLRGKISDTESKLKERELELSHCNQEVTRSRQCLHDKKEEIKHKEQEIQQLKSDMDRLCHTGSTPAQPRMAQADAALQAEVQHYRRVVQDLTTQLEQERKQQSTAAPGNDVQELLRLRGEVQWHQGERQRMLQEIGVLKSSEELLAAQVRTYMEDFKNEREDRERAHARMGKMAEEIANLNHIVTMLGGQQPPQNFHPPQ